MRPPFSRIVFGLLAICVASPVRAVDETVVINEVFAPATGPKWVEIKNLRATAADLGPYWFCDQPAALYFRLLQTPSFGGPSSSPPIVLGPGDLLVIKFGTGLPFGDYQTRPNAAGHTTHSISLPFSESFVLQQANNNNSIWDETLAGPETPTFDSEILIRDFVAFAADGTYNGSKRGCVARLAGLWPDLLSGACFENPDTAEFPAVNSAPFVGNNSFSINYNGRSANNPTDYFLAPPTEGEENIMPGDMDDDYDLDANDAALFEGCIGQPTSNAPCAPGDLDHNGFADCGDWPLFLTDWAMYSPDPAPFSPSCQGCMRGDLNGDGFVNGDDIEIFTAVLGGADSDPRHLCAADLDMNSVVDCNDMLGFAVTLLDRSAACVRGDLTGDGTVNGDDMQPFITAFLTPGCLSLPLYCAIDVNNDLVINNADLEAFISLLLSSSP